MKINYKTYNVLGEAHRIASILRQSETAQGNSVAIDTVRWLLGDKVTVTVDSDYNPNAIYTATPR